MYAVEIKYILFDGTTDVEMVRVVDEISYHVIHSFTVLIDTLRNNHGGFLVSSEEDLQKVVDYNRTVDELGKKIQQRNGTLADALEDFLELANDENNVLSINPDALTKVSNYISPVALASNFFVHTLKGHHFVDYSELNKKMRTFLFKATPNEAFDGLSAYRNSQGIFCQLYDPSDSYERNKFWHAAKYLNKKLTAISDFALELIDLPATIRKLDFDSIKKCLDVQTENSEAMTSLQISLYLN